ncbi:hypothetical protein AZG88_40315 [Rhodococcus sp. LB1]|nr:hypothetical protein AZG88_40315 [Rhodococcus sp. LB1]
MDNQASGGASPIEKPERVNDAMLPPSKASTGAIRSGETPIVTGRDDELPSRSSEGRRPQRASGSSTLSGSGRLSVGSPFSPIAAAAVIAA